jgi:thioredoxin-dependent peroxiredoxin
MAMPEAGTKAPAFTLKDTEGNTVRLSDFQGKHVVLYFYPKDDTPGCTREACSFRDEQSALKKAGAVVLGVSPDSEASHQKFTKKYSLNFPLLVDEGHAVAEKYGAWGDKVLYGRKFKGMIRSTFLIGPDGKIEKVWPKVKVDGHVEQVKEALEQSGGPIPPSGSGKAKSVRARS